MAIPTIEQIKNQILTEKANQESLAGITSTSKVGIFNIWAYVIAFCTWSVYKAWDIFKVEMDDKIRNQKLYSLLWFRNSALEYRHGHPLNDVTGEYLGEGYTDQEIEDAMIVSRAAVIEIEINNRKHLFIKMAKEEAGTLVKLSDAEQDGVRNYFSRIKPGGTKIITFSDDPDEFKLDITFFYDPLIFDENGVRIDGKDNTSVQKAISDYLANLKFNGEFILAELVDILQGIEGCADREVYINYASANYLDPATYQPIESSYIANSGYMEIAKIMVEDPDTLEITEVSGLSIEFKPKIVKL
jgi:hypothetical protein